MRRRDGLDGRGLRVFWVFGLALGSLWAEEALGRLLRDGLVRL